MIAPLAKFIDWSVLQMAYAIAGLKHAPKPKWKLEEALEFLNGPDFIPAASDPARIEFDGPVELPKRWQSLVDGFSGLAADEIETCIHRGRPFGDKNWVIKAAKELLLESSLRSLGRPKREEKT
jgi:hypothetical protein